MGILNYIWCLLVLSAWTRSEPTTSRNNYNSSDLSYYSNGIQLPVAPSENVENIVGDRSTDEDLPLLRWLAQLYDQMKWTDSNVPAVENNKCRDDMLRYIKHLHNTTLWATKMFDASGRYVGQFLFGNDYWVGSMALCHELANVETNDEVPPFPTHFVVARVRININDQLTPVTRQLNIGQCLPRSCSVTDVRLMLANERNVGKSMTIVGVRTVPGEYSLLGDSKFYTLIGVTVIMAVIMSIATIVEFVTKKRVQKLKQDDAEVQGQNNNNNISDSKNSVCGSREMVLGKDIIDKKKTQESFLKKCLLCFSAVNNGKKILNVKYGSRDAIRCIHGLRVCSILWIILVHTHLEVFAISGNKYMRVITERNFMYQTVSNATFSVDTFFFISGVLVTFTYFKTAAKAKKPLKEDSTQEVLKKSFSKFTLLLIYRFFRLTPAYLFVLGAHELIVKYAYNNSVFTPGLADHITCEKYWWRNALYINNFFPQAEFCMLWSWYISNDTQFYLITVVLLIIAVRSEKHVRLAASIIGVFLITSWVTTFTIALKFNYHITVQEPFSLFDQLYDKPWLRIGPYLVGIVTGYFLFKVNCQMKLNYGVVALGWILSLSCLFGLVYGVGTGLSVTVSAVYSAFGHTAWALSLAWIVSACVFGYGGPFNGLFSCRLFWPFSRLTYCAYLVHPVWMTLSSYMLDGPLHLQQLLVFVIFCGNVVVSFVCAFLVSITYEAPTVNLLKLIF